MKKTWAQWIVITKKIAGIQASIILSVIYCILIVPLGFLLQNLFRDSLSGHNLQKKRNSYWIKRPSQKIDLKWARNQ